MSTISKVAMLLASSLIASMAHAQASEASEGATGTELSDIVVTAQKRADNVQDVPISVTAISGGELIARALNDPVALAKGVPGLNVVTTAGYSGKVNYTLRGVGLNDFSNAQEAAVALYQDELYIAPSTGAALGNFDTARVEVLRGPQGTLFGRSASGGLVQYVSNTPGDQVEGYVNLGLGSYWNRSVESGVTLPLSPSASLRVSGRYAGNDGWFQNSAGKDLESGDSYAGRLQLKLNPTDKISFLLKAEHVRFDSDAATGFIQLAAFADARGESQLLPADQNAYGTPGGNVLGYRDRDGKFFTTATNGSSVHTRRTIFSARATLELGDIILTSITGYVGLRQRYVEDSDGSPDNFIVFMSRNKADEFQQEVRLSQDGDGFRWIAGLFYFDYKLTSPYSVNFPIGIPTFGVPDFGAITTTFQRKKSLAAYGNVELDLTSQLSINVGGRVERERARFDFVQIYLNPFVTQFILGGPPVVFNPASVGDLAKVKQVYGSGNIGLNYKPDDNVLAYVTLKRGIKPAGFNTPTGPLANDSMPFSAEKLDALEAGVKSDLFDRTVRFNLSAFYYWYNDYQAIQFAQVGTFTTNADARIQGIDWDIQWLATPQLEIGTSGTVLRARAKDISRSTPGGVLTRNRDLPNAPGLTLAGYAQYRVPAADGEVVLRLDSSFRSKTDFSLQNDESLTQNNYAVLDASVAWRKDNLNLSIGVTNLTNKKYFAYKLDSTSFGYVLGVPGRPREFRASVAYSW